RSCRFGMDGSWPRIGTRPPVGPHRMALALSVVPSGVSSALRWSDFGAGAGAKAAGPSSGRENGATVSGPARRPLLTLPAPLDACSRAPRPASIPRPVAGLFQRLADYRLRRQFLAVEHRADALHSGLAQHQLPERVP